MSVRIDRRTGVVFVALLAVACARAPEAASSRAEPGTTKVAPEAEAPAGGLAFVDRVWVVDSSNAVAKGSVRVFLHDGTLVLADPGSTPAFGRWKFEEGRLTVVEEGIAYPVDLDEVRGETLRITMHSPGEPVRMTLHDARPAWLAR